MKELDSEEIYDDYPADYHAKLGQDTDQTSLLGHDQAKTIDNRCHRDESANGAQPFRHQERREERSGEKHHRERYDV